MKKGAGTSRRLAGSTRPMGMNVSGAGSSYFKVPLVRQRLMAEQKGYLIMEMKFMHDGGLISEIHWEF